MGWSDEETITKKGMETSTKILLGIIACVVLIIILICALLIFIKQTTYTINVDTKKITINKDTFSIKIDDITYINIQEFAKLVGYEYHDGEYKAYTIEDNKCYVQNKSETATFYLNDNKVCKLPVDKLTDDYQGYTTKYTVKSQNGTMYAATDAIELAFNVVLDEKNNNFNIYTLDNLVKIYDEKVKKWGYTGIGEQNFENQKSLLYGYLIVKKEDGLYKIINDENTKEIVSDKYISIQFVENTKEFFVTNSLEQVGIINLDGTTKIEPIYESISVLDKNSDLYLIQKEQKYGVVKSGNITIINPEYDSIGIQNKENLTSSLENQYLILNTLIPVCKKNKWGAFNKDGKKIFEEIYDGFGCDKTTIEVDGNKKTVLPTFTIEKCNGVVLKQNEKYGLIDINGKELVPIAVDSIYTLEGVENEDEKYFMYYNNQELNIIKRLIIAGLIDDENESEDNEEEQPVNDKKSEEYNNNNINTNYSTANSNNNL